VEDVAGNPWAEVAWYFPDSREQFRMLGRLTLVDAASQDAALQKVGCRVLCNWVAGWALLVVVVVVLLVLVVVVVVVVVVGLQQAVCNAGGMDASQQPKPACLPASLPACLGCGGT
jgi:hypothetical protein